MMTVNVLGVLLIVLIVWWFWMYKPKAVMADKQAVTVIVDGGSYTPSRIQLEVGEITTLQFIRKDPSPCAATVVFSDLDISEELPLNKIKTINVPALSVGRYSFTCQMKMYRGELIVESNRQAMD